MSPNACASIAGPRDPRDDVSEGRRDLSSGRDSRDDFAESRRPSRGYEPARTPARQDEDRTAKIVESAIRKFEDRADRVERRTVDALESVASWLHRAEEVRADDGQAIDAIFDRLDTLGDKLAAASAPPPPPAPPPVDFDRRMGDLAARVAGIGSPRPRRDVPAPQGAPAAAKRAPGARPLTHAAPTEAARAYGGAPRRAAVQRQRRGFARGAAAGERTIGRHAPSARAASSPATLTEAAAPQRPAAPLAPSVPTASGEEIAALRADVAAMSRSVANLAPRNAVVALEGALRDLSGRVSALADPEARASLMAPFSAAIAELREAVRAQNVHGVAEALDRDIRALAKKVDTLAAERGRSRGL